MTIKATLVDGMINIDSCNIAYSNIAKMYKTGDGFGLQINDEKIRIEIEKVCHEIADSMRLLDKLCKGKEK